MNLKKLTHTLLAVLCFLASGLFLYAFIWTLEASMLTPFVQVLYGVSFAMSILTLMYLIANLVDHATFLRAS